MEYFKTSEDADAFEKELTYLLVTQRAAFNSPVWFNCGLFHQYGIQGTSGNHRWDFDTNQVVEPQVPMNILNAPLVLFKAYQMI